MAKRKSKAAPQAVQTREQAVEAIARYGVVDRLIKRFEADANTKVSEIAKKLDADTVELKAEKDALFAGIQVYCEVNREALTGGGKVKNHDFGTGKITWTNRPPKVSIRGGVEAFIERCRVLGLARFIRVKEEPNREAMLEEKTVAGAIDGVTIGSEGEDFGLEVAELGNSDVTSARAA